MQAAWSAGQAVLLLGAAGMGKTRLLQDFVGATPQVLHAVARAGDAQTPYAVMTSLLDGLWAAWPLQLPQPVRRELARLLPALGDAPRAASQQGLLRRAIESALQAAPAQGLAVVALDDLHSAGLATLDCVHWLTASPVLSILRFAFAARPDASAPWQDVQPAWLADSGRPQAIWMSPWTPQEVGQLLLTLQSSAGLPMDAPDATTLHAHAGGHPFFTLESLKALAASREHAGRARLSLPATVRSLIEQRLQDLSPDTQHLLHGAALMGRALDAHVLARVLHWPVIELSAPGAELERADILRAGALPTT